MGQLLKPLLNEKICVDISKKILPKNDLKNEVSPGFDEIDNLPSRLARYEVAKNRSLVMTDYLMSIGETALADRIRSCCDWLLFHHYYTVGKVRLARANMCKKALLEPLCAIRRGSKQLKAYLDRFKAIKARRGEIQASMVTFTVKNGQDLLERYEHLLKCLKVLSQRRRNSARKRVKSEWRKVLGDVGSFEVTYSKKHGWHPHCHFIVLHEEKINQSALSREWKEISKDSFIVDVTAIQHPDEPERDFVEVFKYNLKFSSLPPDKNYEAFKILSGRRLIQSHGLFFNVQVPEDLTDELFEDLPYFELFYKWVQGSGYNFNSLSKVIP